MNSSMLQPLRAGSGPDPAELLAGSGRADPGKRQAPPSA